MTFKISCRKQLIYRVVRRNLKINYSHLRKTSKSTLGRQNTELLNNFKVLFPCYATLLKKAVTRYIVFTLVRSMPGKTSHNTRPSPPESPVGLLRVSHPLANDLGVLDRYHNSRSIRLAFLSALRNSLGILPEDAGAQFTKEFGKLPKSAQKDVVNELMEGEKDSGKLIISFAPGMQVNHHCNWNPSLGTLDGVEMSVRLENRTATKIMEQNSQNQLANAFVGKMLRKLNAFLKVEGSGFYSDSAPKMLLPTRMNSSIKPQCGSDTTEFSLFVALKDVGPVNVSKIYQCHVNESADPGAGGCELRSQALSARLPSLLSPYLRRYISALEFRVNLIRSTQRWMERFLLQEDKNPPTLARLKFEGSFPPELNDTDEALKDLKRKLNRKLSTVQIDFTDIRISAKLGARTGQDGAIPYRAEVALKLDKK